MRPDSIRFDRWAPHTTNVEELAQDNARDDARTPHADARIFGALVGDALSPNVELKGSASPIIIPSQLGPTIDLRGSASTTVAHGALRSTKILDTLSSTRVLQGCELAAAYSKSYDSTNVYLKGCELTAVYPNALSPAGDVKDYVWTNVHLEDCALTVVHLEDCALTVVHLEDCALTVVHLEDYDSTTSSASALYPSVNLKDHLWTTANSKGCVSTVLTPG